jgi:hypothetical protein
MSGPINICAAALSIQPRTENELLLLSALHEAEAHSQRIEVHAFELQASNILNEAYKSTEEALAAVMDAISFSSFFLTYSLLLSPLPLDVSCSS